VLSRHDYGGVCGHGIRYDIFLLMAHRIVFWSDNKLCISPVLSSHSAASIVSFDSTFSDSTASYWKMSPTASASEVPSHPSAGFEASLPKFPEDGKMSRSGYTTPGDSFVRHDTYFFKDGNVTFLVHRLLYFAHLMPCADQPAD
jgi:hypothetical protein